VSAASAQAYCPRDNFRVARHSGAIR
jgi:hypothetical protein